MTGKVNYIMILLLTLAMVDLKAQNSQVLYYMNIPQNHFLNPAIRPTNSVYIGLPGVSGINVNINNNFFNFSDIFSLNAAGDSTISIFHPDYNISEFTRKIKDLNTIEPQVSVQLFGLGFSAGRDLYIFIDVNERVDMDFALPGDLLRLTFEGNEQFVGERIDLTSLRTGISWYREAGLGFSKNITDKLRFGIKGKMLSGVANVSLDNKSLNVTINEDYTHTLDADLMANISAPVEFYMNSGNIIDSVSFDDSRFESGSQVSDYLLKTGNTGFGLDIGAEYNFSEKFKISASVTDLGYIKWNRDLTNLRAESQFIFSGIDFQDVYEGEKSFGEVAEELLDSLQRSFYIADTDIPYRTRLPFGVNAGFSYSPSNSFTLGLLSHTRVNGDQYRHALTLSANVNIGNAFSTTLAYTATNYRYDNLGFGLAFRLGIFQIYALADRIPLTWNKIISGKDSFPVPESLNIIHARLGMNLVFGNKMKWKSDKPMVLIQQ
ncbi:MAG TPA: hypothetical protein DDW27_04000 [Bacteroidales bacterium]|nr:hypothetical protein [Bacteroidales bacterium]